MMNVFLIIVTLYIIVTLILFGIDFYYYIVEKYCRFHIGRYTSNSGWEERTIKKSIQWLKHTPTVRITDNNRYLLMDMLTGKYRSNIIQSWQIGALILGLDSLGEEYKNEVEKEITYIITSKGEFVKNPEAIDCGLLCYSILNVCNPKAVRPAMDFAKNLIIHNIKEDNMIAYTNIAEARERYVDTIGLAVPFLFLYAEKYNQKDIADIAFEQLQLFTRYGLEKKTLLPNHAFDSVNKLPLGVYGWGRGCAWYCIGLMDSYLVINDGEYKEWIYEQIKKIADSYKNFQHDDGGFGYIMQMEKGYDSSVTAVMAYYYKNCAIIYNKKEYHDIYIKCMAKLRSVTRITGALDWCQGDTKGIGIFAKKFGVMPFAQGFLIRSFERKK
ncbi:MAG: glycoside hydrolase family 88 protein [Blautia obeum]